MSRSKETSRRKLEQHLRQELKKRKRKKRRAREVLYSLSLLAGIAAIYIATNLDVRLLDQRSKDLGRNHLEHGTPIPSAEWEWAYPVLQNATTFFATHAGAGSGSFIHGSVINQPDILFIPTAEHNLRARNIPADSSKDSLVLRLSEAGERFSLITLNPGEWSVVESLSQDFAVIALKLGGSFSQAVADKRALREVNTAWDGGAVAGAGFPSYYRFEMGAADPVSAEQPYVRVFFPGAAGVYLGPAGGRGDSGGTVIDRDGKFVGVIIRESWTDTVYIQRADEFFELAERAASALR